MESNVLKEGTICNNHYFNNFVVVELNGKYNYIKSDGTLLSEQWFDNCWPFKKGFGAIELDGKWNFLNENGKILSPDLWFDNFKF